LREAGKVDSPDAEKAIARITPLPKRYQLLIQDLYRLSGQTFLSLKGLKISEKITPVYWHCFYCFDWGGVVLGGIEREISRFSLHCAV
jgi:hypothetical protein